MRRYASGQAGDEAQAGAMERILATAEMEDDKDRRQVQNHGKYYGGAAYGLVKQRRKWAQDIEDQDRRYP